MDATDTAIVLDALRVYRVRMAADLADMHGRNPAANLCALLRRTLDTVDRLLTEFAS